MAENNCGKLDISNINYDNVVVIGNTVWIKAQVEEKIWFYKGRAGTIIKFDDACYATVCDDRKDIPLGVLFGIDILDLFDNCRDNPLKKCCPQDSITEFSDKWYAYARHCDQALVLKVSKQKISEAESQGWQKVDGPFDCPAECDLKELAGDKKPLIICNDITTGPKIQAITTRESLGNLVNQDNIKKALEATDWTNMNNRGIIQTAVMPVAAVIPMKSNIFTYGPYASANFGSSSGGTQVEVNTDLCPWVFGSIAAMNNAGNSIVSSAAMGLTKSETGSITVPGLPTAQFTGLGMALGGAGPTLSSISFAYGSGGITTSYQFQTYTPKFGGLNRHLIDKIKNIAKYRTDMVRFLRSNQATQNKIGNKIQRITKRAAAQGIQLIPPKNRACLDRILIGDIYDWQKAGSGENDKYGQRTVVGNSKLYDSIAEMSEFTNFSGKAFMSLDGLFGPVSVSGDAGLPRYASYSNVTERQSLSKNAHPPIKVDSEYEINIKINRDYLNPLTNKVNSNNHHHTGSGMGHGIDLVGHGTGVPVSGLIRAFYKEDAPDKYPNDYRFLGMRGPLVLHSWGYDIDGKPIPNEADIESDTKNGNFQSTSLKDKFLKDWLQKPATWPVAPVDLRFDRDRGVWVAPQTTRIIRAKLDNQLTASGNCQASVIFDDAPIYNKDGSQITEGKITIYEKLGIVYPSGANVFTYFDTSSKQYIILEAGGSGVACAPPTGVWNIDKIDLKSIPNWDNSKMQVLIHYSGCLQWMDTTTCPSGS